MSRAGGGLVVLILMVFAGPGDLSGQMCVGYPNGDGVPFVGGEIGFAENATLFSAFGGLNPAGPMAVDLHLGVIKLDDIDIGFEEVEAPNGFTMGGRLTFTSATLGIPICPNIGLTYQTIEDTDLNILVFPIGVGLGGETRLQQGARLIFFGVPQLLVIRTSIDNEVVDESETDTEFGVEIGTTLAGERLFGSFSILLSTEDDGTTFSIGAGATF